VSEMAGRSFGKKCLERRKRMECTLIATADQTGFSAADSGAVGDLSRALLQPMAGSGADRSGGRR
jgi:hypothetical protein